MQIDKDIHPQFAQFELFPGSTARPLIPAKPRYLLKDLTLSVENIIVLCILCMMSLILFFSFGVEKGKRIGLGTLTKGVQEPLTVGSSITAVAAPGQEKKEDVTVSVPGRKAVDSQPAPRIAPPSSTMAADSSLSQTQDQGSEFSPLLQDVGKNFTIQVASFKREENARKEAMRLKERGYDIFVLPSGSHSVVCVGKFVQKDAAKQFLNKLKNKYNDCLVRRL